MPAKPSHLSNFQHFHGCHSGSGDLNTAFVVSEKKTTIRKGVLQDVGRWGSFDNASITLSTQHSHRTIIKDPRKCAMREPHTETYCRPLCGIRSILCGKKIRTTENHSPANNRTQHHKDVVMLYLPAFPRS